MALIRALWQARTRAGTGVYAKPHLGKMSLGAAGTPARIKFVSCARIGSWLCKRVYVSVKAMKFLEFSICPLLQDWEFFPFFSLTTQIQFVEDAGYLRYTHIPPQSA